MGRLPEIDVDLLASLRRRYDYQSYFGSSRASGCTTTGPAWTVRILWTPSTASSKDGWRRTTSRSGWVEVTEAPSTPTEVDVVVVGAGLAGHAVALAAAEAGASVLLPENVARYGFLHDGRRGLLFAGTQLQREAGVADSSERLGEDLCVAGQGKNIPAVVGSYIRDLMPTSSSSSVTATPSFLASRTRSRMS